MAAPLPHALHTCDEAVSVPSTGQRTAILLPVFKLLTTPATNDRGPRYMERVLASIHESQRLSMPIAVHFAVVNGHIGLVIEFAEADERFITEPLMAHYPNCSLATVVGIDEAPAGWATWFADLRLW